MLIIACTQDDVMPDECPECGGWLHAERHGGFPGTSDWRYCSEDCAAGAQHHADVLTRETHLYQRDLLCDCGTCIEHGHPTYEELAEYHAYVASQRVAR